jgi:hypothetical protein
MNSNDAAGGAFDELRGVVRECEQGAARFDHDRVSKKTRWPRYGIGANSLVLAGWRSLGRSEKQPDGGAS